MTDPLKVILWSRLERPSVETMGLEELRSELLATRECVQTLNKVWQEAEGDVARAEQEGALVMQKACVEWAQAWIEDGGGDVDSLLAGLVGIPVPGECGGVE